MKLNNQKVLICGVREVKRNGKSTLYFLDWYIDGAKQSFVDENEASTWQNFVGKFVTVTIDIGEYQDKVQYRISLPTAA